MSQEHPVRVAMNGKLVESSADTFEGAVDKAVEIIEELKTEARDQ